MQRLRLGVVRGRVQRLSDGFHICSDRGTGTIDWIHPITPRRILLWEAAAGFPGHICGGHLSIEHLDAARPDGHLEGTHLLDARGIPGREVFFETGPMVFGRFLFGVVMEDETGNREEQSATIISCVINSAPPPPRGLRPSAWDGVGGRMEFTFSPSSRLAG